MAQQCQCPCGVLVREKVYGPKGPLFNPNTRSHLLVEKVVHCQLYGTMTLT